MNELKPCPFCGGSASIDSDTRMGHGGCDLYAWYVECDNCGVRTPTAADEAIRDKEGIRLISDGFFEATRMWNSRAEATHE